MHIAVIGAAGMIGRKFVERLARDGGLADRPVEQLTLVDVVEPTAPAGAPGVVRTVAADLSDGTTATDLIETRPDLIVDLAAIVSGQAEADLELGYRVNLDGTRLLLEAIRQAHLADGYRPRLVFTSSIAVYGPPFPDPIPDEHHLTPQTSYGTQKAIGELLINDWTRRGFCDGVSIRLPTICIRPGLPNAAASGFFSSILREPLVGKPAVLPVPDTVRHWHASPRSAVGFLIHAATLDTTAIGPDRALIMPGVSATVAEQIEALRRVAGDEAVALIERKPDPAIMRIVDSWAPGFAATRARSLGFVADESFDAIVAAHVADELGG